MEHWWKDIDREKLKFLDKNLFQCPFHLPQITHGLRYAVFWNFTQCNLVLCCRRFRRTYLCHFQGTAWPLKMGRICCVEMSVTNYQSTLRNIPEERRSLLHRGGSLKSYPHGLTWNQSPTSAVRYRRLAAWDMEIRITLFDIEIRIIVFTI
jgi:hypothetical protein